MPISRLVCLLIDPGVIDVVQQMHTANSEVNLMDLELLTIDLRINT